MNFTDLKVSDFGEKSLIKLIIRKTQKLQKNHFILGDDAAVLSINNKNLIASSDMLIQSRHFPKEMSYNQMGFKSVTVNVSDLAAMGSKPLGFLLNIAIPSNFLMKNFNDLIRGVLEACKFYNIPLVGGDTNEANEVIISGTALGISKNQFLKKSGFKNGDLVCVTGKLGLAALGFEILNKDFNCETSKIAILKVLKPIAKINEGTSLNSIASACTDITDGLASELYEILNSDKDSFKGILIYEEKLAISSEYKKIAKSIGKNYLKLVLNVGEDFELLFTISKDNISKLKGNIDFNIIGEVNNSSKIEIQRIDGGIQNISKEGYNHFIN
ncbi:MAG: thiamine-phosphate kinase [Methanobacteriaceae archaeon]|jgi:thiamine-monophosphate kinase|nr:thiamine-phosphate kinase [Methanobacteriaceae archaeon]